MENKTVYEICVDGCDASTEFSMELTKEEFEIIKKVAEKVTATSTYGCEPTMEIKEKS